VLVFKKILISSSKDQFSGSIRILLFKLPLLPVLIFDHHVYPVLFHELFHELLLEKSHGSYGENQSIVQS
jgi:hypothetical protein